MKSPVRRKTAKPTKSAKATKQKTDASRKLLQQLIAALDAKKAGDLQVLDVSAVSSITDYLVVATATSDPHLRALRIELERVLDENKVPILGIDTMKGSGWTVVDAFDIMVHVFTPENRERYRLELLWKDARELPIVELLASK
jgi:ribosome-associated protein